MNGESRPIAAVACKPSRGTAHDAAQHTKEKQMSSLHRSIRRMRRPTRLPTVVPTTTWGRYLHRLLWMFGGA
jgi:hypothetical protein